MQPPAQELGARDLHETSWTFRHIYRGIEPFKTSPLPPPPFPLIYVCYPLVFL